MVEDVRYNIRKLEISILSSAKDNRIHDRTRGSGIRNKSRTRAA